MRKAGSYTSPTSWTASLRGEDATRALVLCLARWNPGPDRTRMAEGIARSGRVAWEKFFEIVVAHAVIPIVNRNLEEIRDVVPAQVSLRLKALQMLISAKGEALWEKERHLLGTLADAGITAKSFKGPGLAVRLFGHPGLRMPGDLDILVNDDDICAAEVVLRELGCIPLVKDHAFHKTYIWNSHSGPGIVVELHKRVAHPYLGVGDREIIRYFLASEGLNIWELLLLMLHMARHRTLRLKWLCDIDAYLSKMIPAYGSYSALRSEIIKTARHYRMQRLVEVCLELYQAVYGEVSLRSLISFPPAKFRKIWFVPLWSSGWWAKASPYFGKYTLIDGRLRVAYHSLRYPPYLSIWWERRRNLALSSSRGRIKKGYALD